MKSLNIIYRIILFGVWNLFFIISLNGQSACIGNNGYLQQTYLELGITNCGAFGPLTAPPPATGGDSNNFAGLGSVADAGQDGWTNGTPNFCGDYFLPGLPVEGWGIEFDGNSYINGNAFGECADNDINITAGCVVTLSNNSHTWRGAVAGMQVTQTTSISNTNDLFAVVNVVLKNTTNQPMTRVYYARNTDPDNGFISSNTYQTTNTATSAPCRNVVTATSGQCYLALASSDARAVPSYGGFLIDQTISNYILGAPPIHNFSGSNTADRAISIGFNLGTIPPEGSVSFSFAYVFSATQLSNALDETDPDIGPCVITANGVDISSNPTSSIPCGKKVNLTINQPNYIWTWNPVPNISVNASGTNAVVSPNSTTVYTVTGTGLCGSVTKQIKVIVEDGCCKIKPDFNFKIGKDCGVQLTNTTTIGSATTILSVLWDFGDGNTSTAWAPFHYYSSTGTFTITLTIIGVGANGECCSEKITKKIKIKCEIPPCVLDANFTRNYLGGPVFSFTNTTVSNSITTITGYRWEVNGVFVSASQNLTHTFPKGVHSVCLTVYGYNKEGECCQDTICKKVCLKRKIFGRWINCSKMTIPKEPIPSKELLIFKN